MTDDVPPDWFDQLLAKRMFVCPTDVQPDFHCEVASHLYGVSIPDVTTEQRYAAKEYAFRRMYGRVNNDFLVTSYFKKGPIGEPAP